MNILQAALLGLVQELAEMLPISSSAHLVLLPWLFRFSAPGLTFDVALHVGTLVALLSYFWREWLNIGTSLIKLARERAITSQSQRLALLLAIEWQNKNVNGDHVIAELPGNSDTTDFRVSAYIGLSTVIGWFGHE